MKLVRLSWFLSGTIWGSILAVALSQDEVLGWKMLLYALMVLTIQLAIFLYQTHKIIGGEK